MVMPERNEKHKPPKSPSQVAAAEPIKELRESVALDGLFAKIDAGEVQQLAHEEVAELTML
jgi:putative transposase